MKCSHITSHVVQTTMEAHGGSKNVYKEVCRPASENNGSFKGDKSGQLIVIGVVVFLAVAAIFLK